MTSRRRAQQRGIAAALLSAVFLGTAPIFGKQAYAAGMTPIPLAAWRILIAAAGLWLVYALIGRRYLYIYPAGLIGCAAVGAVNGIGSLMYYLGLEGVDGGGGPVARRRVRLRTAPGDRPARELRDAGADAHAVRRDFDGGGRVRGQSDRRVVVGPLCGVAADARPGLRDGRLAAGHVPRREAAGQHADSAHRH